MSRGAACLAFLPLLAMCATAPAGQTYFFSHPSGLAAEAEFDLVDDTSLNFDTGSYGPGAGVSGEWGYGNAGGSGNLTNFITVNQAHATPFGGDNLTGPESLEGPRAGLGTDPILLDIGGLAAVQDEVIATLAISKALDDLDFLDQNTVSIEFGSDAVLVIVPEPWAATLAGLGLLGFLASLRRRRRRAAPPA